MAPHERGAQRIAAVLLDRVMPKPGKAGPLLGRERTPAGADLGTATLGLSRHFRIRPVTRDDRVMTNVSIRVPVTFQTPNVPVP